MKNKLLSLLVSVFVAFGMWLYVITVVSPGSSETIHDIPLTMVGETVLNERGLIITSNIDNIKIDLQLSGNRSDLTQVNASNITLKADLSKIYEPGVHTLEYSVTYPGSVASNAFVIESSYPETVTITVEKRDYKEIPVKIEWVGSTPEDYISEREDAVLDYQYISVSGPSSVVSQIHEAKIRVDLTDRKESIDESYRYTLCNKDGEPVDAQLITVNVEEVRVNVSILMVKKVKLVVTIEDGGGATSSTIDYAIEPETIRVAGSTSALENLEEINIGTIKLAELEEDEKLTFEIPIREGIKNLSNVEEATVDLKFKNLEILEFKIEDVNFIGLSEDLKVEMYEEYVTIRVRGPAGVMRLLTEKDITVTVDLTGAGVGQEKYKVQVTFSGGFNLVGVLGKPQITAEIQQATP